MNGLDAILNAHGGGAVRELGAQVGLGPDQTTAALSALMPALAAGFQRNLQQSGGLDNLMNALSSGHHAQYVDDPASLAAPTAVAEGNGILGHLFGSKEVSREVATRAAAQTGLGVDVLKRLLPLAATMMMGAFAKQQSGRGPGVPAGLGGSGGGIAAMLTPLLDQNRDGSIMDDLSSIIGRFIKRT
jgi:hypothetical protein